MSTYGSMMIPVNKRYLNCYSRGFQNSHRFFFLLHKGSSPYINLKMILEISTVCFATFAKKEMAHI